MKTTISYLICVGSVVNKPIKMKIFSYNIQLQKRWFSKKLVLDAIMELRLGSHLGELGPVRMGPL